MRKNERFEIRQILLYVAIIHNICKFNASFNIIKKLSKNNLKYYKINNLKFL